MDDHLEELREILTWLEDAGLKVNVLKSKFCTKKQAILIQTPPVESQTSTISWNWNGQILQRSINKVK